MQSSPGFNPVRLLGFMHLTPSLPLLTPASLPLRGLTHSQTPLLGSSEGSDSATLARLLSSPPGGSSAASSLRLGDAGPPGSGLGPGGKQVSVTRTHVFSQHDPHLCKGCSLGGRETAPQTRPPPFSSDRLEISEENMTKPAGSSASSGPQVPRATGQRRWAWQLSLLRD